MNKKKSGSLGAVGTLIVAIITVTGAGSYDFSNTTTTNINDNSVNTDIAETTTNNFWDSITNAPEEMIKDVVQDYANEEICKLDPIPDNYAERCAER